jgi:hypothetical protein
MTVPVGDRVATGKRGEEALGAIGPASRVVDEADPDALCLHDAALGELRAKRRLVHVPVHRLDGGERPQLVEERGGGEVADVQDERGALQEPAAAFREAARAAREMRIADERDQRKSGTNAPSR